MLASDWNWDEMIPNGTLVKQNISMLYGDGGLFMFF